VQPRSGAGLVQRLRAATSTMGMFGDECCEFDADAKVLIDVAWAAFCEWSTRRRLPVTLSKNTFSGEVHKAFPEVVSGRPRDGNSLERPRWFFGMRLRAGRF
jgi:hypothetical protein